MQRQAMLQRASHAQAFIEAEQQPRARQISLQVVSAPHSLINAKVKAFISCLPVKLELPHIFASFIRHSKGFVLSQGMIIFETFPPSLSSSHLVLSQDGDDPFSVLLDDAPEQIWPPFEQSDGEGASLEEHVEDVLLLLLLVQGVRTQTAVLCTQ